MEIFYIVSRSDRPLFDHIDTIAQLLSHGCALGSLNLKLSCTMAPRKDDDFMDVDSDSDISMPGDADDIGTRKGKGKAKIGDKRKRDKGKGKAKDAVNNTSSSYQILLLT